MLYDNQNLNIFFRLHLIKVISVSVSDKCTANTPTGSTTHINFPSMASTHLFHTFGMRSIRYHMNYVTKMFLQICGFSWISQWAAACWARATQRQIVIFGTWSHTGPLISKNWINLRRCEIGTERTVRRYFCVLCFSLRKNNKNGNQWHCSPWQSRLKFGLRLAITMVDGLI